MNTYPGHSLFKTRCIVGKEYQTIFIGTSMICLLEAIYQNRSGCAVLMLDQQPRIGGAWAAMEIFGLHDVENAVHYFLNDPAAFEFMKNNLGWTIVPSPRKFWIFPSLPFLPRRLTFDNPAGQFLGRLIDNRARHQEGLGFAAVKTAMQEMVVTLKHKSQYVEGGTPEMLKKVERILRDSTVEVRLSHLVDSIDVDRQAGSVEVTSRGETFRAKKIFFTHGSRIRNLHVDRVPVAVNEQVHLRPQLHLLIEDHFPSEVYEGIFPGDGLIKYIHDVTRFTREALRASADHHKIFAVALQNHCARENAVYEQVFRKLKESAVIGADARLLDRNWWDATLPALDDIELERLRILLYPHAETLRTENFPAGIGYHVNRWATRIRQPSRISSEEVTA